jgi:outer membrane protein TolC
MFLTGLYGCCAPQPRTCSLPPLPPAPQRPADHLYTLDELILLSILRNPGLEAARYEAEAVQGVVDQVKSLWLPALRYDFAATAYNNDLSYRVRAYHLATINVPLTGAYNITNNFALAQIVATGGKRTSALKQAKMLAKLARLDILRKQDLVSLEVATLYYLVCLANDTDNVLEDMLRRMRVYRQVADNVTARGSLRSNRLNNLEADLVISEFEQLQIAVQGTRQQAYAALKQVVGLDPSEPMLLRSASLPPAVTPEEFVSAAKSVALGFMRRPENREVDLFAKIFAEQVRFAKAAWAPNVAFVLNEIDVTGNHNTILNALQGLIVGVIFDLPLYQPQRRGQLREALNLEQASLAIQHEVEQVITLDIQASAIHAQEALALWLHAAHAEQIAEDHFQTAREAYSRELIAAPPLVVALAVDAVGKIGNLTATFNYHVARANLRRATAERNVPYGH